MKRVFKLSCLNELCQALFPSMGSKLSFLLWFFALHREICFRKERRQGEEAATSVVGHQKHPEAPLQRLNCMSLGVLPPPSKLFTPSLAGFERGLGSVYKAASPRNTHQPQCIKLPPLYSRNQTGSSFWPLKLSYSVWTQNSYFPPILNLPQLEKANELQRSG